MALFNDSVFVEWYENSIAVTSEQHKVVNGRCVLNYIPDRFFGVTAFQGATQIFSIKENQTLTASNQFTIDYSSGFITFYQDSLDNEFVTFNYSKRGLILYPVDRIYKSLSNDGMTVIETLQDFMDTVSAYENKGIYDNSTTYKLSNIVLYHNSSYISTSVEDIVGIVPTDTTKWKSLTQGVYDRGDYNNSTQYYVGDMVWDINTKSKYIVIVKPSVGTAVTNSTYWTKVMDFSSIYTEVSHMVHLGTYNPATQYVKHNQVEYQGSSYVMKSDTPVTNVLPTMTSSWNLVSQAGSNIRFRGAYDNGVAYILNDCVSYNNFSYICKLATTGNNPDNTTYWEIFSQIKVGEIKNIITLPSNTNTFNINIPEYNKNNDIIEVVMNSVVLYEGEDYEISDYTQGRIDKISGEWNSGTKMYIRILKNLRQVINTSDGTLIENGTISLAKLSSELQDAINANVTRVRSYRGSTTILQSAPTNTINVGGVISQYSFNTDLLVVYLNGIFQQEGTDYNISTNNIIKASGNYGGSEVGDSDLLEFIVMKSITDVPLVGFSGSLVQDGTLNPSALSSLILQNLAALNSTPGILTQTGVNTFTKRNLASSSNKITITNPDGVSGNPTVTVNEDNFNFANGLIQNEKSSTPSTPASGFNKLYPKSDGKWYKKNDDGFESCLENWVNVKDFGAIGDGIADDYVVLNNMLTFIDSNSTDIFFPKGTYKIGSNITFPSNVVLHFANGAMLSPDSTKIITINGSIDAGLYHIFSGSGSINGSLQVKEIYPQWFGAKGDGTTDDISAFVKLNLFLESQLVSTEMVYNAVSASEIAVNLCGKEYIISDCFNISKNIVLAHVNFKNGTIKAKSDFLSTDAVAINHLIRIGNNIDGITANIKFNNVIFDGIESISGVYLYRTLNTVFNACTFTNVDIGIEQYTGGNTHETVVTSCYFVNKYDTAPLYLGTAALKLHVDNQITDNNIIGFTDGILISGGGNIIKGNHIYALPELGNGIVTGSLSSNNLIDNNYFDGCGIKIARGGFLTNITNNLFYSCRRYCPIEILNSGGNYIQNCNVLNNQMLFDIARTPQINNKPCTITGDTLTCSEAIFSEKMIGSISTGNFQISGYIDANNVYIKKLTTIADGSYNFWFFPCDINIWQHGSEFTNIQRNFKYQNNSVYNGVNCDYNMNSKIYNPPSLTTGSINSTTITVIGSVLGDDVRATHSQPLQGVRLWAEVTATDEITCYYHNVTGSSVDVAQGTLKVTVIK